MWPIRRITVPSTNITTATMTPAVAATLVRLHDDLTSALPDEDDRPGVQQWRSQVVGRPDNPDKYVFGVPATADYADDVPLARGYSGSYSWIATIVPSAGPTGLGAAIDYPVNLLQPFRPEYSSAMCDVSVAVFHKRDATPSIASERIIIGELYPGAELVAIGNSVSDVDAAFQDITQGQWLALAGVRPNGQFLLKWYKILYLDPETDDQLKPVPSQTRTVIGRRLTLEGPDWPSDTLVDLRAIFVPGVIGVSTQSLRMEPAN
jgi:hypothetical protein